MESSVRTSGCECLRDCSRSSDAMMTVPCVAHLLKDTYCAGNRYSCARYKVYQSLGEGNVPADLFPHQHGRLREILV
jgi:hypothetical protein